GRRTEASVYGRRASYASRRSGYNGLPGPPEGRSDPAASSFARRATSSLNRLVGYTASTRRQSTARLPRTPSAAVLKQSARSRRTLRLSTTRVRPPVPGRTPSSGVSGRLTAELPSSTRKISSQARASSYPPPAQTPLIAARNLSPELWLASSMASLVSLVNLQKLTLKPWLLDPSMKMFAPAQKIRSFRLLTTTA